MALAALEGLVGGSNDIAETKSKLEWIGVEWYPKPEHSRRENMVADLRDVVRRDWGTDKCVMHVDQRVRRLLEVNDRGRVIFC